jgi:cytochrome P450
MNDAAPSIPFDTEIVSEFRDTYAMFGEMRRTQPVSRVEVTGRTIYIVLKYDDVSAVLRDPETFSSRIMRAVMGPVMGRTILEMGGQEHTTYRSLVSHAFRPKEIERYGVELIAPLVDEMLDAILCGGHRAELVSQLTTDFPLAVIARMLGVPIRDTAQFQKWSLDLIGYKPNAPDKGLAASRALKEYLAPILAQRKLEPRPDVISELLAARLDGRGLTDDEIFGFLLLLLPAGAETTFRLLGNVLFALLAHPEQLEEVRADPQQLPWALEETLRWEPPLLGTARETTRDVTLRGVDIPTRTMVSAMIGPANHDPDHYPDPEHFDIHRHADDHLSFGLGKHFCLGYHLARLEVLTAVRAVLDRLPNVRLDASQESYIQGVSFRSPNRLPVLFD